MFPHRRMPCHITILYVYSIVSLAALFHATLVVAEIVVIKHTNSTPELKHIFDQELTFSAMVPDEGVPGLLTISSPLAACAPIRPPPFPSNDTFAWFVLVARFECGLAEKARFAQEAGYDVVVIYDRKPHNSGPFGTEITPEPKYIPVKGKENDLNIYAVIVSEENGIQLKRFTYIDKYELKLYPESYQNLLNYLVPFVVIICVCVGGLSCFALVRFCRDWCKKKKSRLSRRHLKLLKTIKFKKNESPYETCAICIEDYVDGDKLRLLPCSHAYHCKCIDPWLLDNRRTCPICKRKVQLPGMDPDSDSESDTDMGRGATERTPLLAGGAGSGGSNSGTFGPAIPWTTVATEAVSGAPMSSGNVTIATFHREDGAPSASRSCPTTTHVSTAHSVNCDGESSLDDEEEVVVRSGSHGGSSPRGVEVVHSVLS